MKFTFAYGEFARDRICVREVVDAIASGLEDDFFLAINANEWSICLLFKVGRNNLAIGFSFRGEHG